MDCIDCHNSVGHPFAGTPQKAVDQAIAAAAVSRDLPFARREGLRLLQAAYPTHEAGAREIDKSLRGFYQSRGAVDEQKLSRAVAGVQDAYRRSIFPAEKVVWGTYPNNLGHTTSTGCFRCHDVAYGQGRIDDQRRLRVLPQADRDPDSGGQIQIRATPAPRPVHPHRR